MTDPMGNIGAVLAARARRTLRRQIGNALLFGLALFFLGIAMAAGSVAIGVALTKLWGGLAASLIIAFAALVAAIGLGVAVKLRSKADRRRRKAELAQLQQSLSAVRAMVPDLTTSKALLIAIALGLVVGLMSGPSKQKDDE